VRATQLHPGWLAASLVIGALTLAVLIATWRGMLSAWGFALPFGVAARIWAVSNLGRYVPGRVWQVGAMAVMARQAGVPAIAATGTAVISTIVNIAMGLAIAMALGWSRLDVLARGNARVGLVLVGLAVIGLASLPWTIRAVVTVAERVTRRQFGLPDIPQRVVLIALAGNLVAWVLFGLSFQCVAWGVIPEHPGTPADYIAVFAASYVVGYLFIVVPGGIGVRETVIADALVAIGIATGAAWIVALVSRLVLTVLEILPGALFLLFRPRTPTDGPPPPLQPAVRD
jgi:glycosyltransferase 2 family protein